MQLRRTLITALRNHILSGLTLSSACELENVDFSEIKALIIQGEKRTKDSADSLPTLLATTVKAATAAYEQDLLSLVIQTANGDDLTTTETITFPNGSIQTIMRTEKVKDWRSAAWLLEKRFPERYALKAVTPETTNKSQVTRVLFSVIPPVNSIDVSPETKALEGK